MNAPRSDEPAFREGGEPPAGPIPSIRLPGWIKRRWGGYSTEISTIADYPIEETGLSNALATLKERDPMAEGWIRHLYHRLRILVRRSKQLDAEAKERLTQRNEEIKRAQSLIDTQVNEHREQLKLIEVDAEAFALEGEQDLAAAEEKAAQCVARAGGSFPPKSPTDDCLPQVKVPSGEVIAARLGKPNLDQDKSLLYGELVKWIMTIFFGLFVGVSFLSMMGAIQIDTILTRPKMGQFLGAAIVGIPVSAFMGAVVRGAFFFASQSGWLGTSTDTRPGYIRAVGLALFICLIESIVEMAGIMRYAAMNSNVDNLSPGAQPTGSTAPAFAYVVGSLLIGVSYFGYQALSGVVFGRIAALNQIRREQYEIEATLTASLTATAEHKEATSALAAFRAIALRVERREARFAAQIEKHQALIKSLEATRPGLESELLEVEKQLLQDLEDRRCLNQRYADAVYEWHAEGNSRKRTTESARGWSIGRWFQGFWRPRFRRCSR